MPCPSLGKRKSVKKVLIILNIIFSYYFYNKVKAGVNFGNLCGAIVFNFNKSCTNQWGKI
jgi:hypothetical protein